MTAKSRVTVFVTLMAIVTPVYAQDVPPALQASVLRYLAPDLEFQHSLIDLNGDAIMDAIVLMLSPSYCGSGGCDMFVFRGTRVGFTFLSGSSITNAPVPNRRGK